MAISKSAKQSVRQAERRRIFNLRRRRVMRSAVKNVTDRLARKELAEAAAALPEAYKAIDKAAKRGILKKNTAARKKSRLANAISKQQ